MIYYCICEKNFPQEKIFVGYWDKQLFPFGFRRDLKRRGIAVDSQGNLVCDLERYSISSAEKTEVEAQDLAFRRG